MRFAGRLQDWNEQRGFGFIHPVEGGDDVFVHVSALPSPRPGTEEIVTFELTLDREGRKKAIHVRRQADETAALNADRGREGHRLANPQRTQPRRHSRARTSRVLAPLVILGAVGWFGYGLYAQGRAASAPARVLETGSRPAPARIAGTPAFACDGRTHCSQMRSCEEAAFFLQHCPDTAMDGDHDGVPCEQQLCSSGWR